MIIEKCMRCVETDRLEDEIYAIKDYIMEELGMCIDIEGQFDDVIMYTNWEILELLKEDCNCVDDGFI